MSSGLSDPGSCRNKEADWLRYYDKARAEAVRSLLDEHPDLVEEHRRNPLSGEGEQSLALQTLLNYFRGHPSLGKYYVYATVPWTEYRIATLTRRGAGPDLVDDRTFTSEAEAAHEVLVLRVNSIGGSHD